MKTKSISELNNLIKDTKRTIEFCKEMTNNDNTSIKDKKKYNLLLSKSNKNLIKYMNELEDIKKENE